MTAFLPARLLGGRVLWIPDDVDVDAFLDQHDPETVIVGKAIVDDRMPRVAEAAKRRGLRVITAYCDWYFGADDQSKWFKREFDVSDDIVVQTIPMADEFRKYTGREPVIIEEPWEYPRKPVKFQPELPTIRLLWFGNQQNYHTIPSAIESLARLSDLKIRLAVMSFTLPEEIEEHFPNGLPGNIKCSWFPWSMSEQYKLMKQCDVIIIPSMDTPENRIKGHNRLVEGINAGRAVVAYPLPQYKELRDYAILHEDMTSGLEQALANRQETIEKIRAGQSYIDTRFAPEVVAEKWRHLLDGD